MHDNLDPTARDHLTPFTLDRLLARETLGTASAYAHLDRCAHCQERYAACMAEQRACLADDAVHERVETLVTALDHARASLRWHQRLGRWPCLFALAVLVFFLGLWPHLHHGEGACSHGRCPVIPGAPAPPAAPADAPCASAPGS
jgi:predicted anti-sigma-YlaC factor YlaD